VAACTVKHHSVVCGQWEHNQDSQLLTAGHSVCPTDVVQDLSLRRPACKPDLTPAASVKNVNKLR